jgi:hypothetical protein
VNVRRPSSVVRQSSDGRTPPSVRRPSDAGGVGGSAHPPAPPRNRTVSAASRSRPSFHRAAKLASRRPLPRLLPRTPNAEESANFSEKTRPPAGGSPMRSPDGRQRTWWMPGFEPACAGDWQVSRNRPPWPTPALLPWPYHPVHEPRHADRDDGDAREEQHDRPHGDGEQEHALHGLPALSLPCPSPNPGDQEQRAHHAHHVVPRLRASVPGTSAGDNRERREAGDDRLARRWPGRSLWHHAIDHETILAPSVPLAPPREHDVRADELDRSQRQRDPERQEEQADDHHEHGNARCHAQRGCPARHEPILASLRPGDPEPVTWRENASGRHLERMARSLAPTRRSSSESATGTRSRGRITTSSAQNRRAEPPIEPALEHTRKPPAPVVRAGSGSCGARALPLPSLMFAAVNCGHDGQLAAVGRPISGRTGPHRGRGLLAHSGHYARQHRGGG